MFWIVGGQPLALAIASVFLDPLPAAVTYQFEHAEWIGFTAWDLIMPLFLFVVGAAMPFSFARRLEQGHSKAELLGKILRRSAILFLLGMVVQGHLLDFKLSTLHLYCNTLQAIAAGYLIAGVLMLWVGIWSQATIAVLLLVGYWLLLKYVPFAGHPAGVLEPDANLALWIDETILGRFRDGTTYTWILSSMTFASTVLLGVMAGHLLRTAQLPVRKFYWLTGLGLALLAGGWAWSEWLGLPIIKHIWTSSMVLWAAGWSFLLLALFYLLIDIAGVRAWAFPFIVIGMNAITIYVANFFIPFREIAERLVGGLAEHFGRGGPIVVEFIAVLLAWLLLYHLYRQRIFLRI
jgi:predicted acyltransferase